MTLAVGRLLEWGVAGHAQGAAGEKTEQEEMGRDQVGRDEGGQERQRPGGASEGSYLTLKGLPGGEQSKEAGAVRTSRNPERFEI